MKKVSHTNEPWIVDCNQFDRMSYSGFIIRSCNSDDNGESKDLMLIGLGDVEGNKNIYPTLKESDAIRIVDCVNAFEGIEDPFNYIKGVKILEREYYELRNELSKLRVELDKLHNSQNPQNHDSTRSTLTN